LVSGASVRVGAQVVPVASEVEAAQFGFGLSEQVAFAEEHFVVLCRDPRYAERSRDRGGSSRDELETSGEVADRPNTGAADDCLAIIAEAGLRRAAALLLVQGGCDGAKGRAIEITRKRHLAPFRGRVSEAL
jgi:hypothetical protein